MFSLIFSNIFLNNEMKEDVLKVVQNLPNQDGAIDTIMMGMTINGLMATFFFSIIGMGYFSYGRKTDHTFVLICGVTLMGFPYFVSNTIYILLIGISVGLLPMLLRILRKMGI